MVKPEIRGITGMRHKLIPGYVCIDPGLIWAVVYKELPLCKEKIVEIKRKPEKGDKI